VTRRGATAAGWEEKTVSFFTELGYFIIIIFYFGLPAD